MSAHGHTCRSRVPVTHALAAEAHLRLFACGLLAAAALLAGLLPFLLLLRFLTGWLAAPIGGAAMLSGTILALAVAIGFRLGTSWFPWATPSAPRDALLNGAPTVCLAVGLLALLPLNESRWAAGISLLLVAVAEICWWRQLHLRLPWSSPASFRLVRPATPAPQPGVGRDQAAALGNTTVEEPADASEEQDEPALLPEPLDQQLSRWRETGGGEVASGLVRCRFAAGEVQQLVHVAFCPPFSTAPQLQAAVIDGEARLTVDLVESFGVRLSVRRAARDLSSASCILIHFEARGSEQ